MKYPILTLSDISLSYDSEPLFSRLNISIDKGDRICLVGRNGCGKSTILKLIAGKLEFDKGERFVKPGVSISMMDQDPNILAYKCFEDFIYDGLSKTEVFKVDHIVRSLGVKLQEPPSNASGGELRRAALVKVLAGNPTLLLLDEPTNHLDLFAIEWLEKYLLTTKQAFILISHDQRLLKAVVKRTFWLDRGVGRIMERGFSFFEDWRDKLYAEEKSNKKKLEKKIKAESLWAVEGISARRKRNQGRLEKLKLLRAKSSNYIPIKQTAKLDLMSERKSGKTVIEAYKVSKSFNNKILFNNFTYRIKQGDRIAILGPNGAGKTTLINILLKIIEPDSGTIKLGSKLDISVFSQSRYSICDDESLWEALVNDKVLGKSGKNDQIMVRGKPKNIVGYLKEFMFSERQVQSRVSDLSGGEKARLCFAIIMAKSSNLLILDEPTNDLDIETLDLLREIISNYEGTVIFVSHDRDFIDSLAMTTIFMGKRNTPIIHSGGYSDYIDNQPEQVLPKRQRNRVVCKNKLTISNEKPGKDQKRLEEITNTINQLSLEVSKLEQFLADPNIYLDKPEKFKWAADELKERKKLLEVAESEWLTLEV